jgi:hypothetical protein
VRTDLGREVRLGDEAFDGFRVHLGRGEYLERAVPLQAGLVGAVDHAHASLRQLLDDVVGPDGGGQRVADLREGGGRFGGDGLGHLRLRSARIDLGWSVEVALRCGSSLTS